jgi:general secretion pathway protein M
MSIAAIAAGFWKDRSSRERRVLLAAGALILVAAVYSLLWEPGLAARKSLSATLPRLRAQVDDMRRQQRDVLALRKQVGAVPQRGDLKSLLQASAVRTAFAQAVERAESLSSGMVLVRAGPVSFDAWLQWVESLQRDLGVRVDSCRISALEQPGMVRVEASFASGSAQASRNAP